MTWLVWLTCKRVRELTRELAGTRRDHQEALESLRALYECQQAWKVRALTAEARLTQAMRASHPSCQPVMHEFAETRRQIRELPEVDR